VGIFYPSVTNGDAGDASLNGAGGSLIHKLVYILSRLHMRYYGLRFRITCRVDLVVLVTWPVNCSVATSNDACMRGIRGFFLACRVS
jgi:hypothetical protein